MVSSSYLPDLAESRSGKQVSCLKPANASNGKRYSLVITNKDIKPFQEITAWEKPTAWVKPAAWEKPTAKLSSSLSMTAPSLKRGRPVQVGQAAATQRQSCPELPIEIDQKREVAKAQAPAPDPSMPGMNSDDFFNVFVPARRTYVPVRAWRPLPPSEKPAKVSSMPDLKFSPQLQGKPLLRQALGVAPPSHQRFSETLKSTSRERLPEVSGPLPASFNVNSSFYRKDGKELRGRPQPFSIREPHFFFH